MLGDEFDPLDLGIFLRILCAPAIAARVALTLASRTGGLVRGNGGVQIDTIRLASIALPELNRLILLCGGKGLSEWEELLASIRRGDGPTEPTCLVGCVPASEPAILPIVRRGRRFWACPGGSATLDLGMLLIEELIDRSAALELAAELMLPLLRHPDDSAIGPALSLQIKAGAPFAPLMRHVLSDLTADLRVETLAEWCNMSPRTFARRFVRQVGTTPAEAIARLRLERARQLMSRGGLGLKEAAARSGFGSELGLRRATTRFKESVTKHKLVLVGQD